MGLFSPRPRVAPPRPKIGHIFKQDPGGWRLEVRLFEFVPGEHGWRPKEVIMFHWTWDHLPTIEEIEAKRISLSFKAWEAHGIYLQANEQA